MKILDFYLKYESKSERFLPLLAFTALQVLNIILIRSILKEELGIELYRNDKVSVVIVSLGILLINYLILSPRWYSQDWLNIIRGTKLYNSSWTLIYVIVSVLSFFIYPVIR